MASFKELVNGVTPVLVDVYADWCGPCQAMGPELEKLSASMGDTAKVLKVNLDRNQPLAEAYGIRSVPTLMIFKEGKMLWKASGFHSKDQMQQALQPFLN
jgi:thioredoxin 1